MKATRCSPPEFLEARIAPAGVVTVTYDAATGVLTLDGDAAANTVAIFATGAATHLIQATESTLLDGGVKVREVGKVTSLVINGGDGDDTFEVSELLKLKSFAFDGGPGGETLRLTDVNVKGPLTIEGGTGLMSTNFEGTTTLVAGDLDATNSFLFFRSQTVKIGGSLLVEAEAGASAEFSSPFGTVSIARGIAIQNDLGAGSLIFGSDLIVTIGKLASGESIQYVGLDPSPTQNLEFGSGNFTLAGGITLTAAGSGKVKFLNEGGVTRLGKLPSGHSVLIETGKVAEFTATSGVFTAAGGVEFTGGTGNHVLALGAPGAKLTLGKLQTGESIKYGAAQGTDDALTLTAAKAVLAGGLDFIGGAGTNALALNLPNGVFKVGKLTSGESLRYFGGPGADSIAATGTDFTLAGGIGFTGDAGVNSVTFDSANGKLRIGKFSEGYSVTYKGGSSSDDLILRGASVVVDGSIHFNGAGSVNNATISASPGIGVLQIGRNSQGRSLEFQGGPVSNNATLSGGTVVLKGSAEMTVLGTGDLSISGGALTNVGRNNDGAALLFTGGTGPSFASIFGGGNVTLAGDVTFQATAGQNSLGLASSQRLVVKGTVNLEGSSLSSGSAALALSSGGTQPLVVEGPVSLSTGGGSGSLAIASPALQLRQTLTFLGGTGTDTVDIRANGTIVGDVNLGLGASAGGTQSVLLEPMTNRLPGLVLKGRLDVLSAVAAASNDGLTLRGVTVTEGLTATLGAGISTVTIENLFAKDVFTLDTGGGVDSVAFERGNLFGNSVITKLATILTGAGNDTVLIGAVNAPLPNAGSNDSSRGRFLAGLTLDGGAGTDTRNAIDTENDFPGDAPTGLATFETVVP